MEFGQGQGVSSGSPRPGSTVRASGSKTGVPTPGASSSAGLKQGGQTWVIEDEVVPTEGASGQFNTAVEFSTARFEANGGAITVVPDVGNTSRTITYVFDPSGSTGRKAASFDSGTGKYTSVSDVSSWLLWMAREASRSGGSSYAYGEDNTIRADEPGRSVVYQLEGLYLIVWAQGGSWSASVRYGLNDGDVAILTAAGRPAPSPSQSAPPVAPTSEQSPVPNG